MYCVIYFQVYDNVINGIKERFPQPDFEIYKHMQNIYLMWLIKNVTKNISVYLKKRMEEIFIGRT